MGQAVAAAEERLAAAGVSEPRAEAQRLLGELTGWRRGGVVSRRDDPLDPALLERFQAWVERRERREPFQHIVGTQEFYGVELAVDSRVLVPRPETEGVIDAVLALELPTGAEVVDLGTGSGCLPIVLAIRRPDLRLRALDRSRDALEVARANACRHDVDARIVFEEGDLADPPASWTGQLHVVVSNPPYVAEDEWARLEPEVRDHDPREALVAGPTGLELYGPLCHAARRLLRPHGTLIAEVGDGQADAVAQVATEAGFEQVEVRPDLRSVPRILVAR